MCINHIQAYINKYTRIWKETRIALFRWKVARGLQPCALTQHHPLAKNPFYGVWWARVDKWQGQSARWRIMESSRNFSCDTCLSEFAKGWVRDHESPNGIKNYQREDTNQNPRRWLTPYNHLYMDPSSQRSRGWNLVSCRELLLVFWWNFIVLGDLSFAWGEEGLPS